MHPVVWIILIAIGALLGGSLGSSDRVFFGALIGIVLGAVCAELLVVRGRLLGLESEVTRLRAALKKRAAEESIADAQPVPAPRPPAPASAQAAAAPVDVLVAKRRAEIPHRPSTAAPVPAAALLDEYRESLERPRATRAPIADPPLVAAVKRFLTGGNTLVRMGVIVLFFGVAFLLRYAAEHTRVPIEFRMAGVGLAGLVLLVLGWVLRKSRAGYALALQGCAIGILYLTIFASLRLYALLPPSAAFLLLAAVAVLSAALAVLQNSMAFAVLGITGGFLAPILASTGQGSHVALFSYFAILNAGILIMAWFKAWRPLNLVGFLFTFVIATVWGVLQYRAQDFASTEPFLIGFFLFYVAIAVLFTLRQPPNLKGYVDGSLVFGVPIVAFGLQSGMLRDHLFTLAYSAVAVSALYLCLAVILQRARNPAQRLLVEAFLALGVVFLTLAVPLALDARWNAATWGLEGCALIWIGCRQQRLLPRVFGALLTVAAGIVVAGEFSVTAGKLSLYQGASLSVLVLAVASVFSARSLNAHRASLRGGETLLIPALFLWGLLWWLLDGAAQIDRYLAQFSAASLMVFVALTAAMCSELSRRLKLNVARGTAYFLLPALAVFAVNALVAATHPFSHGGWLSWPVGFAVFYWLARRHDGQIDIELSNVVHVAAAWLLSGIVCWETAWATNEFVAGSASWPAAAAAVLPAVFLMLLPSLTSRFSWPFAAHRSAYAYAAAGGLAAFLACWSVLTNLSLPGDSGPLPYVPLLNPLDVVQVLALMALLRYWRFLRVDPSVDPRVAPAGLAALGFIWANGVLLRSLHQWFGIAFTISSFANSTLVQTSLSIFWTALALATMLIAARKSNRGAWVAGAVLLVVVIAKLFLVDLSRIESIARIVSFVGVGVLMSVVGYWSPIPPAKKPEPT
jgi:uncharacterized membrane protein